MKKVLLALFFFCAPLHATSYFLAPASLGGSDSNNGLSTGTPWLSPNHAVNCGDIIMAAASSSYSPSNFTAGKWGTVTCPAGNSVAWVQCATFDACRISTSSGDGMRISSNYWGVQGFEVTTSGGEYACFSATPSGTATIHHIIFANNVANGCGANGFTTFNNGQASVDYVIIVANIAYNAAQNNGECFSGISIYQPVASDSNAGTHIYVAGNFSYKNFEPNPCAGGAPSDGEGIIFDTFDGSQGGLPVPYSQQAVAENNMLLSNGGRGFEIFNNVAGSSHATVYVKNNTAWGNNGDTHQNATYCGEFLISLAYSTTVTNNIGATNAANGCGSNPAYAFYVGSSNGSDAVASNVGYSATGTFGGINNSPGFSYGSNLFGTNPNFSNPVAPGAPSCGSFANVTACMGTLIANFTPQTASAKGFGYQPVSLNQTGDPLFPQWLCNVNLPTGLLTMGCMSAPQPPTDLTVTGVN